MYRLWRFASSSTRIVVVYKRYTSKEHRQMMTGGAQKLSWSSMLLVKDWASLSLWFLP